MTTVGDELQESVRFLLDEMGEAMTFRRVVRGSYDPATGTTSGSDTNDDETVRVAFTGFREELKALLDQRAGRADVEMGDRKALMAAVDTRGRTLSKTPQAGDKLIGVADDVKVISVRRVRAGARVVGYAMEVAE